MRFHDDDPSGLMPAERDACAIICYINKAGKPTHGNVQRTIDALIKMGHRAGEINGEGDGCGILTDIPRDIWAESWPVRGLPRRSPRTRALPSAISWWNGNSWRGIPSC